ncbi:MAG TPA: putative toxin-antitoxin system toxin component, PIN family [Verrucomicrobiae bacterium]|nr:putative toxin-antitoxin system toxin component, PIN family [Verrucomicrobiae bacterium]
MNPREAVLDTNVLIAALRSRRGASFELLRLVGNERWRLHLSTALLLEYEEVARREASHLWVQPDRIEDVLSFLAASGQEHAISFRWRPFLNDPDDDFILELAVAANARYIVTHNVRDFAAAASFGIEAITPAQMLLKLQETN